MAKKRESKKKRASSVSSDDADTGNSKALSKFVTFEMEAPADNAASGNPADFVPTLSVATADGGVVSMEAAPALQAAGADELIPVHIIQSMASQSVAVAPGSTAGIVMAPGGLLREPDAPKVIHRVTVEGAPPPSMRLELVSLLS